jgi:hypothetical protein
MSQSITPLSVDSLANVLGAEGSSNAHRNVAQSGGAEYFDHSYGFGNVRHRRDRTGAILKTYATPNGFARRAASVDGDSVKVHDRQGMLAIF